MKFYTFTGLGSVKICGGGYNVSRTDEFRITGRALIWGFIQVIARGGGQHEVFSNQ